MPTLDGKLGPKEIPMSDADWETNKDCDLKKRTHKYRWKSPDSNIGVCAHCGKEIVLTRKDGDRD